MKKFEYKAFYPSKSWTIDEFIEALNELGSEGWELCVMTGTVLIFKRELKP